MACTPAIWMYSRYGGGELVAEVPEALEGVVSSSSDEHDGSCGASPAPTLLSGRAAWRLASAEEHHQDYDDAAATLRRRPPFLPPAPLHIAGLRVAWFTRSATCVRLNGLAAEPARGKKSGNRR